MEMNRKQLSILIGTNVLCLILVSSFFLFYNSITGNNYKATISLLKNENEELKTKMSKIKSEILELEYSDRIESLDWEPSEDAEFILSFDTDNYISMTEFYLLEEDTEVVKEHLDKLVKDLPYVGSYELYKIPEENKSWYVPEGHESYDLNFYVDIHYVNEISEDESLMNELNNLAHKHDLKGLFN